MTWQEEVDLQADLAAKKAREEASEETRIETARNYLEMGLSPEQVAKGSTLPLEKVLELQKEASLVKA